MARFQDLPTEIIHQIIADLPVLTVENLAKTFNRSLTLACLPVLKPLLEKRREKIWFKNRFGRILNFSSSATIRYLHNNNCRTTLGLAGSELIRHSDAISPMLDSLTFCGDFSWMKPLDGTLAGRMGRLFRKCPHMNEAAYMTLMSAAEDMQVTIPPVFLKFIQDPELVKRIYNPGADLEFRMHEGRLVEDRGGFYLPFFFENYQRVVGDAMQTGLYIEKGEEGRYCVITQLDPDLRPGECFEGPRCREPERRFLPKHQCFLEETDFETFLANLYYSRLLREMESGRIDPPEELLQFLRKIYLYRPKRR